MEKGMITKCKCTIRKYPLALTQG